MNRRLSLDIQRAEGENQGDDTYDIHKMDQFIRLEPGSVLYHKQGKRQEDGNAVKPIETDAIDLGALEVMGYGDEKGNKEEKSREPLSLPIRDVTRVFGSDVHHVFQGRQKEAKEKRHPAEEIKITEAVQNGAREVQWSLGQVNDDPGK